jgi:hypothetical protein
MHISKKRIRNIRPYVRGFKLGEAIHVALAYPASHKPRLIEIGFTKDLAIGERVLPSSLGPVSTYNAEGKYNVRRDLPMETAYRQTEWHWTEWDGTEQSRIVDVPYERYPREFVPPPSKELQILKNAKGEKVVASDQLTFSLKNLPEITHTVNLFLELFGECDLLKADLVPVVKTPMKRLNWTILPPGKYPWSKLSALVQPILDKAKDGNAPVIKDRLSRVAARVPEFVAVGHGGYRGYVVFGFPKKGVFVLESAYYGNATYVFDQNWEQLSKMTKAEILDGNLQKQRIIHREGWSGTINQLLS